MRSLAPMIVRDVETEIDPLALASGLRSFADGFVDYLLSVEVHPGGWRAALRADPIFQEMALDQLAFAGAFLARLTVLVSECRDVLTAADLETQGDALDNAMTEDAWAIADIRRRAAKAATTA